MAEVQPVKDKPTVTSEGQSLQPLIDGLIIKRLSLQEDERGELCEVYNPAWRIDSAPLVYVYQSMVRPGKVKGWVVHHQQEDRLFVSTGTLRFAFFDARPLSPTHGQLNLFTISERNRALLLIPRGVYHAVQNVGEHDAIFINLPTAPYNHSDPDKYRLPLRNDLIPFAFEDSKGR